MQRHHSSLALLHSCASYAQACSTRSTVSEQEVESTRLSSTTPTQPCMPPSPSLASSPAASPTGSACGQHWALVDLAISSTSYHSSHTNITAMQASSSSDRKS